MVHDVNTYEIDNFSYENLITLQPKNNLINPCKDIIY